jgi:prepilin-type N-terminal cleavage/methylation domain-containing protein
MRQKKAFTLVELLVVIGIITVLIAILLPVISRARRQALRVVCMNQVRQLSTCVVMYESDNKAQLPYCNFGLPDVAAAGAGRRVYGYGWLFAYAAYRTGFPAGSDLNGIWGGLAHPPVDGMQTGLLWPYNQTMKVYRCPMDTEQAVWIGTAWMTSYVMNRAQCGFGTLGGTAKPDQPGYKVSQMRDTSNSVMFWEPVLKKLGGDNDADDLMNDGSASPTDFPLTNRHENGGHVCCFDGHVEWWDQKTFTDWANQTTFGRLWCNPMSANGR